MARQYPRFLFSNPQNTKSTGPFIVHLLPPKMICRVDSHFHPYKIITLDVFDPCDEKDLAEVEQAMLKWFLAQLRSGEAWI